MRSTSLQWTLLMVLPAVPQEEISVAPCPRFVFPKHSTAGTGFMEPNMQTMRFQHQPCSWEKVSLNFITFSLT